MDICSYVAWFGLFSILGWVYECAYCAIRTKRWDNRGFLFGPVCPIYGFGVSALLIVAQALASSGATSANAAWWQVLLCASAGSAVLEYTTSYVLEKCFHARWWDYSNVPLNLNGRICLPFALCFGAALARWARCCTTSCVRSWEAPRSRCRLRPGRSSPFSPWAL